MNKVLNIIGSLLLISPLAFAQSSNEWKEDVDGELTQYEYRMVDPKGAVTRAHCPYTCADRNIPKESCKEWKSITNAEYGQCYVQDLRISGNDAMPEDTLTEAQKTTKAYR